MSALFAFHSQSGTRGGLERSASKCFFISLRCKALIGFGLSIRFVIDVKEKLWTCVQNQTLLLSHFTSWVNYSVTCKRYAKYVSRHNSLVIRKRFLFFHKSAPLLSPNVLKPLVGDLLVVLQCQKHVIFFGLFKYCELSLLVNSRQQDNACNTSTGTDLW